jgi:KRAB domain-containing zinc finger protein
MAENCGKCYKSKFNLKRHVEIVHFHMKRFLCPLCLRFFATNKNLKEHAYLHEEGKLFACEQCGKTFRQGSQLALHLRKHLRDETHANSRPQERVPEENEVLSKISAEQKLKTQS